MLFETGRIRNLTIKNRLVHAPTYEVMAAETGEVTDRLLHRYRKIAEGGTGLIIPGYMYVEARGKSMRYQSGIHTDAMVEGLKKLTDTVHEQESAIFFQLHHGGRQCHHAMTGTPPLAPSASCMDPVFMTTGKTMTQDQIQEVIAAFGAAARRAHAAGADGIQIHAANGFLINQFLSPFFNHRKDEWGGNTENRFRFFKEVYGAVRANIPEEMPVMVKLNIHEHLPGGITPSLAKIYIRMMADLGMDALEPGEGTISFNNFGIWRGDVPVADMVAPLAMWKKPAAWLLMKNFKKRYPFSPKYVLESLGEIKGFPGEIPLFSGGGVRTCKEMEEILHSGQADYISMSRPFIRQPGLAKMLAKNRETVASCISCNRCVAAVNAEIPLGCYAKGLPQV